MNKLIFTLIGAVISLFGIASCNQKTEDKGNGVDSGPVTEVDKQRYNMNSNDVTIYDPLDSTGIDSINKDTSGRNPD